MNQDRVRAACALGALACLLASGCTTMQSEGGFAFEPQATAVGASGLSAADRRFALVAAGTNNYVVAASELASGEAADPRLRDFAARVAQARDVANEELMMILDGRGMVPSETLSPDKQEAMNSLAARTYLVASTDFDNLYMRSVGLQESASDIQLFEQAANSVSDPGLRTWAVQTLPMLRAQQSVAQELAPALTGWNPIGY